jgi:hypothetical protein
MVADFGMTARADDIAWGTFDSLDDVAVYQSTGTPPRNHGYRID